MKWHPTHEPNSWKNICKKCFQNVKWKHCSGTRNLSDSKVGQSMPKRRTHRREHNGASLQIMEDWGSEERLSEPSHYHRWVCFERGDFRRINEIPEINAAVFRPTDDVRVGGGQAAVHLVRLKPNQCPVQNFSHPKATDTVQMSNKSEPWKARWSTSLLKICWPHDQSHILGSNLVLVPSVLLKLLPGFPRDSSNQLTAWATSFVDRVVRVSCA